ncbi:hypothetical protein XELAEV_18038874mg [Xenopus laevis]|uniref:Uncharacterized protein n=1 Tax=Xenopus laevis TaxID=8355 RepID=A0A974H7U1_XENLA|nr:hypothetical protein XELAEV_18038874mg [Xenopus laevis]
MISSPYNRSPVQPDLQSRSGTKRPLNIVPTVVSLGPRQRITTPPALAAAFLHQRHHPSYRRRKGARAVTASHP